MINYPLHYYLLIIVSLYCTSRHLICRKVWRIYSIVEYRSCNKHQDNIPEEQDICEPRIFNTRLMGILRNDLLLFFFLDTAPLYFIYMPALRSGNRINFNLVTRRKGFI